MWLSKCHEENVFNAGVCIPTGDQCVWLTGTVAGSGWSWGEASFPAKSFIGVVAMEMWRPQKLCDEKSMQQKSRCMLTVHSYILGPRLHSQPHSQTSFPGLIPRPHSQALFSGSHSQALFPDLVPRLRPLLATYIHAQSRLRIASSSYIFWWCMYRSGYWSGKKIRVYVSSLEWARCSPIARCISAHARKCPQWWSIAGFIYRKTISQWTSH